MEWHSSTTILTTAVTSILLALGTLACLLALPSAQPKIQLKVVLWRWGFSLLLIASVAGGCNNSLIWNELVQEIFRQSMTFCVELLMVIIGLAAIYDWLGAKQVKALLPYGILCGVLFYVINLLFPMVSLIYKIVVLSIVLGIYLRLELQHQPGAGWLLLSVLLTMLAGAIQAQIWGSISLPKPLNHNSTFFLVLLLTLLPLITGLRKNLRYQIYLQ